MKDMALEDMPTKYKSQVCIYSNILIFFKEQYFTHCEMVQGRNDFSI